MTVQQAFELALQHHQSGRLNEAETLYRQILAVEPRHADSLHLLGLIAHQLGRNAVAVDLIRQAIDQIPGTPFFHSNLGEAHRALGQLDEAIAAYRQAIDLKPDYPEAHSNLGFALYGKGQLDEAIAASRQAIVLRSDFPEAYINLGIALNAKGQLDEAIAAYRQAIDLRSGYPEAYNNLGAAFKGKGQLDDSVTALRQAIALRPGYPEAHNNLGIALNAKGQLDEAISVYRQAIVLKPDYPEANNNLGTALSDKGQLDKAIAAYRQAIALKPDYAAAYSNLLLSLNYHPNIDVRSIAEEHRGWSLRHAEPLRKLIPPHANERAPGRRLRIGYVSPDFRDHSVAYFFEGLLENHDGAQVEVFCYSDVVNPDAVTARMEQSAGHWRRIEGLTDEQVAELIRMDGIDILVDLAGHTANNRLRVFARKPAPVQVTWLGYSNTTGLDMIDYRLTDAFADPPGSSEDLHTEQLVRLPEIFACFRPCEDAPPVGPLPARARGRVTFASFHTLAKLNDELLGCWAGILNDLPDSRLVMAASGLDERSSRERLSGFFASHGIDPGRLEFKARQTLAQYVALHNEVDVLLDSHPFSGHTVSCHALWMGVPVVTLAGKTHCSRMVTSVLTNLGLAEWVAASPEEYVDLAVDLATDLPRLAHLRGTLRERMQASPLMDAAGFARNIEAAYREMWRTWCADQASPPAA